VYEDYSRIEQKRRMRGKEVRLRWKSKLAGQDVRNEEADGEI
jgi:hypothetical protein